jgi:hypothetical protein
VNANTAPIWFQLLFLLVTLAVVYGAWRLFLWLNR